MPMWRVLKPLDKPAEKGRPSEGAYPVGSVQALGWASEDNLARLQRANVITRLSAPPLHKLPGWKLRAKRLGEVGISTAETFLETADEDLAKLVEVDVRAVAAWKAELLARWLSLPTERRR